MTRLLALLALVTLAGGVLAEPGPGTRRSGYDFMSPATQAMQRDDTQNPAMLFVADGEAAWRHAPAGGAKSCAGCHGPAETSMRGVAARYPAIDETLARPVTLAERINLCRTRHQRAPAWRHESPDLLAVEAFVALQSRGSPIAPPADPRLASFRERGEQRFRKRMGQLDLACSQCHDDYAGKRLGGSVIPQGHPTGYPIYRLEWQALGSLQRRLRNCFAGVRAEAPPFGAPELVELEVYLASRAAGMTIDSPAVRP